MAGLSNHSRVRNNMATTKKAAPKAKRVKPKVNPLKPKPKKVAGAGAFYGADSKSKGKKSTLSKKARKA